MKLGYSILLGETLPAADFDYHDCERWQVVCPCCQEPVFKGHRSDAQRDTHYLSHYAAKGAYDAECDLRVGRLGAADVAKANAQSREQRLAYFLAVMQRTLATDPIYEGKAAKAHWTLNKSPGLEILKQFLWEDYYTPGRTTLFEPALNDYLTRLRRSGWEIETPFGEAQQTRIACDMWLMLTTPVARPGFMWLFNHAWKQSFADWMVATTQGTEESRRAAEMIASAMVLMTDANRSKAMGVIDHYMELTLPRAQRRTADGKPYDADPMSFISRIAMGLTEMMAASLYKMPYYELLKQRYGRPGMVYPAVMAAAPRTDEAKLRAAQTARHISFPLRLPAAAKP